jgi:hypothetical protein
MRRASSPGHTSIDGPPWRARAERNGASPLAIAQLDED